MKTHISDFVIYLCLLLLIAIPARANEDYTLYNTLNSTTARLINLSGSLVKYWQCTQTPSASMPYLILPDSTVLRAQRVPNAPMNGAGVGGHIQLFSWNGTLLWQYYYSGTNYQQHHDIQPMPNGNVMFIAWDRKTQAEAQAMGRININGEMWPTAIIEVDPSSDSIVWEWHLWDHLIQDVDVTKPNYGVVSEHPELLNINVGNLGGGPQGSDWLHMNTLDYNEELDQVVMSSHNLHEIYIIDHSTTTQEAAGHTGGNSGMGGDLLYRWGNPQNYDRGSSSDQHLFVVHGVNWIDPGLSGAGNILLFNNGDRPGTSNDYSSVEEIVPPVTGYTYYIHPDSAYGPATPVWMYSNPGSFYSQHLSGAFRLSNGNTFICQGTSGYLFEITSAGQVVWSFNTGGETQNAKRYDLAATSIEDEPKSTSGRQGLTRISPNPCSRTTTISYTLSHDSRVTLKIYDCTGRTVKTLASSAMQAGNYDVRFDTEMLPSGVYLVSLILDDPVQHSTETRMLVLTK